MTNEQPAAAAASPERRPAGNPEKPERRARHRPALLARFPRFFWRPPEADPWEDDWPVVPAKSLAAYPLLEPDLRVWPDHLEARFRRLDHQAQILQNRFWRQRVLLIGGGLLATALAAAQTAIGGGNPWLAGIQAVLTGLLAGLTVLVRSRRAQHGYLSSRLRAERIKSEFFLFLARSGDYAGKDRLARLQREVDDIEAAEGDA